jgi:hypothetical protein
MEGNSLLSGGVDQLNEVKEFLLELRGNQANNDTLIAEEDRLEKSISSLEKVISDEIQATVKKRRDEVADTFDQQIDKTRARMKRIKERRDRKKHTKMSERIDMETASLYAENSHLKLEAGTLLKQSRIPAFVNTKMYYSIYSPSCFTDFLIILAAVLAVLIVIPCGVYYLILPEEKVIYLIITYVFSVLLFGILYVAVGSRTKERFTDEIHKVKAIRRSIRINKKKIAVIKKNIRKDRDDSAYGLQNYDEELAVLEKDISELTTQKKDALAAFDNTTKQVIASEIQGLSEEKLKALKSEYDNVVAETKKAEEKIKALTIKIANEYEPLIGKDLMTLDRLESLTNIILAGTAGNISEAIAFYRQSTSRAAEE